MVNLLFSRSSVHTFGVKRACIWAMCATVRKKRAIKQKFWNWTPTNIVQTFINRKTHYSIPWSNHVDRLRQSVVVRGFGAGVARGARRAWAPLTWSFLCSDIATSSFLLSFAWKLSLVAPVLSPIHLWILESDLLDRWGDPSSTTSNQARTDLPTACVFSFANGASSSSCSSSVAAAHITVWFEAAPTLPSSWPHESRLGSTYIIVLVSILTNIQDQCTMDKHIIWENLFFFWLNHVDLFVLNKASRAWNKLTWK
jgi:hypothetical protein